MIVVVGQPVATGGRKPRAAGLAVGIARAAVAAGADVQLVGKLGDDPTGDAVLVDLARGGIGHPVTLRDPARRTPVGASAIAAGPRPVLEPADLELALDYVPDFRVLILTEIEGPDLIPPAVGAANFAGAHLIVLVGTRSELPSLPATSTVLASPARGRDGAFASVVADYAVALDAGVDSADAWREVSARLGAERRG